MKLLHTLAPFVFVGLGMAQEGARDAAPVALPPQSAELALCVPGTLHGWDLGAELRGWTATESGLRSEAGAGALRSAFAFDDHELRFRVQLATGGALRLRWLKSDESEALALRISAEDLRWMHGETVLATAPRSAPGLEAELVVERKGRTCIARTTDLRSQIELRDADGRLHLGLASEGAGGEVLALRAVEPLGPRITQAELERWTSDGKREAWIVDAEELRLQPGEGRYLASEKLYANFALSFRYRLPHGANSGVSLRTPRGGWPSTDGIELQLLHEPAGAALDENATAALYGNLAPLAHAVRLDEWNDAYIVCEGVHLRAWWNGVLVQCADLSRLPELRDRPARGWIGFQDHGAEIRVRDLRIRELADAGVPPPSRAPLSCAQRVLGGVLESGLLASRDRAAADWPVVASLRETVLAGDGDAVLAEIAGPGVLLRIAGVPARTRLAVHVDGAESPTFEGPIAAFAKEPCSWSASADLLLVALPFARSLRIVVRGAHYSLTADVSYAVARDASASELAPARGFVEVARYRGTQHKDGRIRRREPLRELRTRPQMLAAGGRCKLAIEGRGEVVWLGVTAPPEAFENEDLWIGATSDGKAEPEVLVPLRYYFPARAAGQAARSLTEAGGDLAISRWALPFERGMRLELWNRGTRSFGEVGLVACVRDAREGSVPRPRLVARFGSSGEGAPLEIAGAGVALCFAKSGETPFPKLDLDGVERTFVLRAGSEPLAGRAAGLSWRALTLEGLRFETRFRAASASDAKTCLMAYIW